MIPSINIPVISNLHTFPSASPFISPVPSVKMATDTSRLDEILKRYTTTGSTPDPIRAAALIIKDKKGKSWLQQ